MQHCLNNLSKYWADNTAQTLLPFQLRQLSSWLSQISEDVIMLAIDDTMLAPSPSWRYLAAIMRRCIAQGIRSSADWEQAQQSHRASKKSSIKQVTAQKYEQRTYTEDQLAQGANELIKLVQLQSRKAL